MCKTETGWEEAERNAGWCAPVKLGVSARLKELSGKKDPICIFIDNWFVCVERAGGSGGKGSGRKWWSETARAAIPCLMSWREIVSNWGRSQRGSLSDWPFTVPCHFWPGNINMRPALQHASVSVCGKQRAHAGEPARACMRVSACKSRSPVTHYTSCPARENTPLSLAGGCTPSVCWQTCPWCCGRNRSGTWNTAQPRQNWDRMLNHRRTTSEPQRKGRWWLKKTGNRKLPTARGKEYLPGNYVTAGTKTDW